MEFHRHVTDIYPRFFFELAIVHPYLTDPAIKYCALFLFECTTEEIKCRMGVEARVVHTAKSRLKKSFNLKQNEKLTASSV